MRDDGYSLDEYLDILRNAYITAWGEAYNEKGWHPEDIGMNMNVVNDSVCYALTVAYQREYCGKGKKNGDG